MSRRPWYKWYPADYLQDTIHLSLEEDAAYRRLLDWSWSNGAIPDGLPAIARILRVHPQKARQLWKSLGVFFEKEGGGYRHKKLEQLRGSAERISLIRKKARDGFVGTNAQQNDNKTHGIPDPDPEVREEKDTLSPKPPFSAKNPKAKQAYPDAFEALWITRPKRAGGDDKKRACQAWRARISEGNTQESIQAGVDRYRAYCDGTGKTGTEYVKQMATFLGPADPPHFTEDWAIPQNGNGGTNGSDYDRPIRGSFDWYAERDKRREQERERLDGQETERLLEGDDGVVWEKLED